LTYLENVKNLVPEAEKLYAEYPESAEIDALLRGLVEIGRGYSLSVVAQDQEQVQSSNRSIKAGNEMLGQVGRALIAQGCINQPAPHTSTDVASPSAPASDYEAGRFVAREQSDLRWGQMAGDLFESWEEKSPDPFAY